MYSSMGLSAKCLPKIKGVFLPNTVRNDILLREMDMTPLLTVIEWRISNILRIADESLPQTALKWTPRAKRSMG